MLPLISGGGFATRQDRYRYRPDLPPPNFLIFFRLISLTRFLQFQAREAVSRADTPVPTRGVILHNNDGSSMNLV